MSIDLISLKASKKYVDETIQGAGGLKGEKGDPGKDGADGFSPAAKVEKTGHTAIITIVDKDGPTTVEIKDGEDGRASENTIESISVNGTSLTPDENKNVNIKVPTNTSNLTNDSGFLTEHQDISGKVDKEDGKSLIADTEIERLASVDNYDDTDISARIKAVEDDYVKSEDVTTALAPYAKSADVTDEIISEVAKIVADAPEDFNTLKEMSDWIASHEDDASAMNSAIQANRTDIETLQTNKANTNDLTNHTGNSEIHVTAEDKTAWNKVSDKVDKSSIVTTLNSTVTDEQVASAKSTYDGLKKAESDTKEQFGAASGETITVNDSVNGKISDLMLFGKSEQKQYSGKNLFGFGLSAIDKTEEYRTNAVQRLITSKVDDNEVKLNFNGGNYSTAYLVIDGMDGTQDYAISFKVKDNTTSYTPNIVNDTSLSDVTKLVLRINLTNQGGTVVDKSQYFVLAEIQVERGSAVTDFEPYVGGIPSPNPDYPQEIKSVVNPTVKACRKNLLNKANAEYYIGYSWDAKIQTDWFQAYFNPISSGEYYLNKDVSRFILYDESHNILYGKNFNSRKVIIPKVDNVAYIQFSVWTKETASVEMSKNFFADFMVCKTEEDSNTSYEPYTETTATIPYTLNAIPVSSGGNVTIDGQEYIADYVDVERKKLARMNYDGVIDSSVEIKASTTSDNVWIYNATLPQPLCESYTESIGLADNLIVHSVKDVSFGNVEGIAITHRSSGTRIAINLNDCTSLSDYQEFIASNPIRVVYPLATPIEIDLTDEEVLAFKELRSHDPVTNVFVTSDQLNGYTAFHYPKTDASGIVSEHSVEIEKLKKADMDNFNELKQNIENQCKTASGNFISIDTIEGGIEIEKIYGKSEQKQYSGKNLLNCSGLTEQTINGVTFTPVYENGMLQYINVNGTATSTTYYDLVVGGTFDSSKFAGSIINGCNSKSAFIRISDESRASISDQYNGVDLTIVDNGSNLYLAIRVATGTSLSNEKIYPMIRLATDTDRSYEPYVGGIPSPNPEYPQEIKSVVNPVIKACGKNLLNPTLKTTTMNGVSCIENNDGTYTLNGTATRDANIYLKKINLKVDKNNAYKLVGCPSGGSMNKYCMAILDDRLYWTNFDTGNGRILEVNEYSYQIIAIIVKNGTTVNNLIFKPMLTTDLTATYDDFEPYTETTATLPYTLNAIPVDSGGNITIDGQQYIADYIDVEKKRIVRHCRKKKLGELRFSYEDKLYTSNMTVDIVVPALNNNTAGSIICDSFVVDTANNVYNKTKLNTIGISNGGSLFICAEENDYSDVEIIYALKNTTAELLTDEQIAALYSFESYKDKTHITTEGGMAILDVKYGKNNVAAKAINAERLSIRNNYVEETSDIDFSTEW